MIGIYKITSPSKRVYIGQSKNIARRFMIYRKPERCMNQRKLYNSFMKYGVKKHRFEVVTECDIADLNNLERYYQDLFHAIGKSGLNCILVDSKARPMVMSSETKDKMSKSRKGRPSWNKGVPMCEVTKSRLSESRKGSKAWNKGIPRTDKDKKAMGLGRIGKSLGEENCNHKIILNLETGIYYFGAKEASDSCNLQHHNLKDRFRGKVKNNTAFIQV